MLGRVRRVIVMVTVK